MRKRGLTAVRAVSLGLSFLLGVVSPVLALHPGNRDLERQSDRDT